MEKSALYQASRTGQYDCGMQVNRTADEKVYHVAFPG
jgi:hypothetical protein